MVAHNLPTHATPFIGRADELSRITALLCDPACRLLTLTGPGGIGKTRLAVEVAQLMIDADEDEADTRPPLPPSFSDGSCFVPLQPLTSPDFIIPAIADALHFTLRGKSAPKRHVPEKHRSMRVAFERSWELLTAEEQAVFMRLSVFRGGFAREAAEHVTGATQSIPVSLVDKSLVQVDASGRYDLHELLRQYAADKLLDAGEENITILRHGDYFLHLAERAEAHNFGREQVAWFDRLEIELDNLRAAFVWSLESETGLRLAAVLGWFFSERSHWSEGLDWLERALASNPDAPFTLCAKALNSAGALAAHLGKEGRGRAFLEQALVLARAAHDRWNIAWALCHLAYFAENDLKQSVVLLDESLALFQDIQDAMGISHTLVRRAWRAHQQKDYLNLRHLLEAAEVHARDAGDKIITGWVAFGLGLVFRDRDHDFDQARTHLETSLSLFRQARFPIGVTSALLWLAVVEQQRGDLVRAQELSEEALVLLWESEPDSQFVPSALTVLGSIAKSRGQLERAVRLLGVVNSGQWVQITDFDPESAALQNDVATVRAQLNENAFVEALAAGKAMSREQAISYALEGKSETATPANPSRPEPLNARELEVLSLVASGLSNREIAVKLFVTVNTVKWYLKTIFGKLHVANRAQAVARAQALGLLSHDDSRVESA